MQNQPNMGSGERSEGDDEPRLISPEEAERSRIVDAAVEQIAAGGARLNIEEILEPLAYDEQHDVALRLIEKGKVAVVFYNLDKFQGLGSDVALELVEKGGNDGCLAVAENLDRFSGLDHREIALKIIEKGAGLAVAQNIGEFQGLDRDVALGLIEMGACLAVVENLDRFSDLDRDVALGLIGKNYFFAVATSLDGFHDLDHREIALKIIERGFDGCSAIARNLDRFSGLDHREIALKIIKKGHISIVADNLASFSGDIFRRAETAQRDVMLEPAEFLEINLKEGLASEGSGKEAEPLEQLPPEERHHRIFERLVETGTWRDEQNVIGPFRDGAEIFGYERMFHYLNRDGLSRHDGLHAFNAVVSSFGIFERSGLSADDFYAKILDQVARDGGTYNSGTAHHELNQIALSFDADLTGNLERAKQYQNIPNLQELASQLSSPAEVFASWKNLRRYNELAKLLGKTELLEALEAEPNATLRAYVSELAFHPDGNVDMQKVFEFWHDPKKFLDLPDSHTPEEIHNRKKPSNLAEIPNLDLTPEDLRDALVNGSLDRIQAFAPMAVEYVVIMGCSFREVMGRALGSYREKIAGSADDPKKLFSELAVVLKPAKVTVQQFLAGGEVPLEAEERMRALLLRPGLGLSESAQKKFSAYHVVMRTNAKSDPQGVLAGNDTACCMPFGSGKNNVYTWNPACTLATLEIERPDGSRRTIAQSVLTKDRDIGRNVAEVAERMRNEGEDHLNEIISEDILRSSSAVIACDNVEVAPNYKSEEYQALIEAAYRDFFAEYLTRYGRAQGFADDRVVIGLGYSDALTNLPKVPNTTVPEAPVGYSDKMHEQCHRLSLKPDPAAKFAVLKKEVTAAAEISRDAAKRGQEKKNVSPLTFEDTMAAAYIEGKAYAGNSSLMEYLWKIENTLIAKDINNAAKNRPNMSFKYEHDGKMRGYLIAYEGRLETSEEYAEAGGAAGGEPIVYVADLAVAEPGTLGGGRAGASLVGSFVERYGEEYLKKGNLIPIFAHAREQTSYKLILGMLSRYEGELGVAFSLEEGEPYQEGQDTMHPVFIRPKLRKA